MEVLFPRTLAEMQALMAETPEGMIMAGGTDLLVRLRKTGHMPPALFCIEQLEELRQIEAGPAGLRIGAAVTLQSVLESETVREILPVLLQAVESMASPPVRHAATLGGNVCTASPAGDTLPPLHVLGAEVELLGSAGLRRLTIGEFITGPGKTAALPDEILTGVIIPWPGPDTFSVYHKVGKRKAMAIAVASLAAAVQLTDGDRAGSVRLAWGSVGPVVVRVPQVEAFLTGRSLTHENLREAGRLAADGVKPISDVRAGASYRRQLAGNLLLRLNDIPFRKRS